MPSTPLQKEITAHILSQIATIYATLAGYSGHGGGYDDSTYFVNNLNGLPFAAHTYNYDKETITTIYYDPINRKIHKKRQIWRNILITGREPITIHSIADPNWLDHLRTEVQKIIAGI